MGKPIQLKADLDPALKSANLTNWLQHEQVELILTSSKTGIADIERFHGSLNEHIRILKNRDDVDGLDLVQTALYHYNTSYHSTIKERPQSVHLNNLNVTKALELNKNRRLNLANKGRKESDVNEHYLTRPRVRKLDNPKRFIKDIMPINNDHFIGTRRNNVKHTHYKSNFQRRKKFLTTIL